MYSPRCQVVARSGFSMLCSHCSILSNVINKRKHRQDKMATVKVLNSQTPLHKVPQPVLAEEVKRLRQAKSQLEKQVVKVEKMHDIIPSSDDYLFPWGVDLGYEFKKNQKGKSVRVEETTEDSDRPHSQALTTNGFAKIFWEEQRKNFNRSKSTSHRWSDIMLNFARAIYKRSTLAYNIIRETGVIKLPCHTQWQKMERKLDPPPQELDIPLPENEAGEQMVFVCHVCGADFDSVKRMTKHMLAKHEQNVDPVFMAPAEGVTVLEQAANGNIIRKRTKKPKKKKAKKPKLDTDHPVTDNQGQQQGEPTKKKKKKVPQQSIYALQSTVENVNDLRGHCMQARRQLTRDNIDQTAMAVQSILDTQVPIGATEVVQHTQVRPGTSSARWHTHLAYSDAADADIYTDRHSFTDRQPYTDGQQIVYTTGHQPYYSTQYYTYSNT